jgi:hypothetical protein
MLDSRGQLYINEIHNGEMKIKFKGEPFRKAPSRIEKTMGKLYRDRIVFSAGT